MTEGYDTIIVGAGPAGSTAAYFLSQHGQRVLLLEKQSLPRYKACGGGLSRAFLQQVFPFSIDPVLSSEVSAIMYSYGPASVTIPVPEGGLSMVMRDRFDLHILSHARAEVRQGCAVQKVTEFPDHVSVTTQDGQRLQASYLIAADGANSITARQVGLRKGRRLVAALEAEVRAPRAVLDYFNQSPEFIFGAVRLGYLWVFPKGEHLSVGVASMHPRHRSLKAILHTEMARRGISLEGAVMHGHPIPIYTQRQPIATQRVLLTGDAAGLADPFSGEGIRYAIKSGKLAAECLLSGQPEQYQAAVEREIGRHHLISAAEAQFFYNLQPLCLALGAPNPFTTQGILDLLADRAYTWEVMLRSIATLPVFLFTETTAGLAGLLGGVHLRQRIRAWVYPW